LRRVSAQYLSGDSSKQSFNYEERMKIMQDYIQKNEAATAKESAQSSAERVKPEEFTL